MRRHGVKNSALSRSQRASATENTVAFYARQGIGRSAKPAAMAILAHLAKGHKTRARPKRNRDIHEHPVAPNPVAGRSRIARRYRHALQDGKRGLLAAGRGQPEQTRPGSDPYTHPKAFAFNVQQPAPRPGRRPRRAWRALAEDHADAFHAAV